MNYLKSLFALFYLSCISFTVLAQNVYTPEELDKKLDSLSLFQSGLNNQVQLNVSNIEIVDLLNSIGLENSLNLSVDPKLKELVTYNFFDTRVKDVFSFLYRNYDVRIDFVGSIIIFKKLEIKEPEKPKYQPKTPNVIFNPANKFLSLDLSGDTLHYVIHEIIKSSGENVVVPSSIKNKVVSGYFQNRPFDQILDMFAQSNEFEVEKDENGTYFLNVTAKETQANASSARGGRTNNATTGNSGDFSIQKTSSGNLEISAKNVSISEIIEQAANLLNEHYFLYAIPEGKITLSVNEINFNDLLNKILNGTKYSYQSDNRVYFIGEQSSEGLRSTELIKLEYRTVENVMKSIPKELTSGLEIHEFIELNGLVVSGSSRRIIELRNFLYAIDEVVPMVQIDVMILRSERSSLVATGIKAALDPNNQTTGGSIYPELDMNLNSVSVNAILEALNGFGNLNLGQVTSDFFVSIQALESNNIIETESTPKLSTLNGHEANISIGEERYYQEERVQVSNVVGNANIQNSRIWKKVNASLDVRIKPFVSSDEHVTLEISVSVNDFGPQPDPTAPPPMTTESFQSLVRVKNGEVILMGGLDRKSKRDSGSGVPILSRIPILKWFFSSRSKSKDKSKLHILIRPTVTY